MKILVLNGPNLNMLGKRDVGHYGTSTLEEINQLLEKLGGELGVELIFFQSNHEGDLIDSIQEHRDTVDGILINAGALSHYGLSLRDALTDAGVPVAGVHLSNVYGRSESFRHRDVIAQVSIGGVYGFREASYELGLRGLVRKIREDAE